MHSILSFDLPLMGGFPALEVSRWLGRYKRVTTSSPCKQVQQLRTNHVHWRLCMWYNNYYDIIFVNAAQFYACRATSKHLFLLLLVLLSVYHTAWSLPKNYSAEKNLSQFSNSSKSLINNGSTNLRQRRFSYHNEWDDRLYRVCEVGYGMYHVESRHDNYREDRIWRWECRQVFRNRHQTCSWTSYVNQFDEPILFMCGWNEYLRGVESYHSNHHKDRRWRFYCCHSN